MGQQGRRCPSWGGLWAWGRPHPLAYPPPTSFRMRQVNIVGTSPPSQPSRKIQTLQAPPDMAPANVTLRTASETSLWLRWMVRLQEGSGWGVPWILVTSKGPHQRGIHRNTYCSLVSFSHLAPGKVPDNHS